MKTAIFYLAILAVFAIASSGISVQAQSCNSVKSTDVGFAVSPCPDGDGSPWSPCVFRRGSSAELQVSFTPTYRYRKMRASLNWIGRGEQEYSFPGHYRQLCRSMSPRKCPSPRQPPSVSWSAPVSWGSNKPPGNYNLVLRIADGRVGIVCQPFSIILQ